MIQLTTNANVNILKSTDRLDNTALWIPTAGRLTSFDANGYMYGHYAVEFVPDADNEEKHVLYNDTLDETSGGLILTISAVVGKSADGGSPARTAAVGIYGLDGGFASVYAFVHANTGTDAAYLNESSTGGFTVEDYDVTKITTGIYRARISVSWVLPTQGSWFVQPKVGFAAINGSDTFSFAGDASTGYGKVAAVQAEWASEKSTYNSKA